MNDTKSVVITLKFYPYKPGQENMKDWMDGQMERIMSARIQNKLNQEDRDYVFDKLLDLGYGSSDKVTAVKVVRLADLAKEQLRLRDLFTLSILA